ncbi:hypothetical protein [Plantibacter sp. CFBP 8775]|uniref:hypothetical protein n=1 Tax=Plantibacter sp. CFBP 8775 TaxID=2774038 RepID=UPI00177E4A77|nr:hypothetical protein [Plantibacter sp. CFBP 8775]MBD8103983.1 hypothetical protein [Plantibacter sp. CFBP 8775]
MLLLVLTEGNSTGAAFEAGLAVAMDIPILVAKTPRATVPANLRSFPVVSFKLADPSRILDALRVLSLTTLENIKTPQDTALGDSVKHYRSSAANASAADRIRALTGAIEATGAIVARTEGAEDEGFDIAVWSNDLINSIGAPVLIEVKKFSGAAELKQIRSALRSQPNGAIGLLVFQARTTSSRERTYDPQVLAIQEEALLRDLEKYSFAEIVMRLRNSAAHARSEY